MRPATGATMPKLKTANTTKMKSTPTNTQPKNHAPTTNSEAPTTAIDGTSAPQQTGVQTETSSTEDNPSAEGEVKPPQVNTNTSPDMYKNDSEMTPNPQTNLTQGKGAEMDEIAIFEAAQKRAKENLERDRMALFHSSMKAKQLKVVEEYDKAIPSVLQAYPSGVPGAILRKAYDDTKKLEPVLKQLRDEGKIKETEVGKTTILTWIA